MMAQIVGSFPRFAFISQFDLNTKIEAKLK